MSNIQFNQQRDWFMYINKIISNNTVTEVGNNLLINDDCSINNNLIVNNKIINNNIFETDSSNNIGTIYPINDLSTNLGYYNKQFNNAYISNLYNNYINTNTITVKEDNSKVLLNIKNDNKSYLKLDTTNEQLVLDISFKTLNNFVDFSNNFGIKIPIGTTNERYWNTQGVIRYNTTDQIYEGHDGTSWNTLGGIRDVDKDTYITAEDSPSSDNDELKFYTSGIERMRIDKSGNFLLGNFTLPFTGTFNSSSNNDNLIFRTDNISKRVFINNGLNIGENNNLNEPHNLINNFSLIGGSNCTHSNVAKNSIIYGEDLQSVAESCANFGKGNNAFTTGCLIAGNYADTAINSNTIFAIGIGDSSSNRINALHIDTNGLTRFNNNLYLEGSSNTIYGPSTMYIDPATYNNNTGKLIIRGNLQIDGTTTSINSNIVDISDRTIRLASNATDITQINNTGIEISGNSYYKSFLYKHPSDRWESNIDIIAPRLESTDIITSNISSTNIQKIFDSNIPGGYRTLELKDFDKVSYDNNDNLVIGNNLTFTTGKENTIIGMNSSTSQENELNVIVGAHASITNNANNCILLGPSNDSTHDSSILIGFNIQSRGNDITIIDGNEWHPRNNDQTSLGSQNYKFNNIHVSNINTSNINVNNLDINGTLYVNNNHGSSGQVLTSAGPGSAPTWENPSSGSFTTAMETKLNGIEAGATGDQTGAEIKTALSTAGDLTLLDSNFVVTGSIPLDGFRGFTGPEVVATSSIRLEDSNEQTTFAADFLGNVQFNGQLSVNGDSGSAGQVLTSTGIGGPQWMTPASYYLSADKSGGTELELTTGGSIGGWTVVAATDTTDLNGSSGVWTCPSDGVYLISYELNIEAQGPGYSVDAFIVMNVPNVGESTIRQQSYKVYGQTDPDMFKFFPLQISAMRQITQDTQFFLRAQGQTLASGAPTAPKPRVNTGAHSHMWIYRVS